MNIFNKFEDFCAASVFKSDFRIASDKLQVFLKINLTNEEMTTVQLYGMLNDCHSDGKL